MNLLQKVFQKIFKQIFLQIKDRRNKLQVFYKFQYLSFHTLVKLVDAEDIANDEIRTHDFSLEVISITITNFGYTTI